MLESIWFGRGGCSILVLSMGKMDKDEYSPSHWCQRMPPNEVVAFHYQVLKEGSKTICEQFTRNKLFYGSTEGQIMDIVCNKEQTEDAPVLIFIHGGYWVDGNPSIHLALAEKFVKNGTVFVCIGYDLAPKVTMPRIVEETKSAFSFILKRFSSSRGIYLCGHSAGAQLAARIMEVDWSKQITLTNNTLKGVVLMSGVYDLIPLLNTTINDDLKMTQKTAREESPIEHINEVGRLCTGVDVNVVVAEFDSPAFHQQSFKYYEGCKDVGLNATCTVVPNVDHFSLIENLSKDKYSLTQLIFKMMDIND